MGSERLSTPPSLRPPTVGPHLSLRKRVDPFLPRPVVRKCTFLHPGYPDHQNLLLILPAFDSGGIHHETARVACGILANCRWDGYFATTRDGARLSLGRNDILTPDSYYFIVDGDPTYAVVPSLDHLRFPSSLPPSWSDAPILPATSDGVRERDRTCRITCSTLANEVAPIVPTTQDAWWRKNSMLRYAAQPEISLDTDCPENAILLRRDLRHLWDNHTFAILPKQGTWVVHVWANSPTCELDQYHNLTLQPLIGVGREFLLARFALGVFDRAIFARQGVPRTLLILEDNEPVAKRLSGEDCLVLFGRGKRSGSPLGREALSLVVGGSGSRESPQDTRADWFSERSAKSLKRSRWVSESASDGDTSGDDCAVSDEESRGRPKKRQLGLFWTLSPSPCGLIPGST